MGRKRLDDSRLEQLIGRIYDMALEPEVSESVATEIGDLMGGAAVVAGYFQIVDGKASEYGVSVRFDPEVVRKVNEELSTPDVNPLVAKLDALPRRRPLSLPEIVDPETFPGSPFHEGVFRPQRFSSCLYALLQDKPWYGCLAAYGFERQGDFTPEQRALMERIIPHFTRCFQIQQRLLGAKQERLGVAKALDRMPFGVIFLGFRGEVLFANRCAEAILSQGDGLTVSNNRVRAATGDRSAELSRLIAAAAETSAGRGDSAGGSLGLPRPSGRRPLLAQVMPLRYDEPPLGGRSPAAVLFVSDPEQSQETPEQVLSRLFGLTQQEAALAALITEGHGLVEAAERLSVTRNTAHTHLNRIFAKTGTSRQAELVRLLLTSPAVLAERSSE